MDFIAIDFEIANEQLNSACSIGLAYVENNVVVKEKYFLIKPPRLQFNSRFTRIHGITAADVENERSFEEIWDLIKEDFTNHLLVAHNAQFDMSVLYACLQTYHLDIPDISYVCSIAISTHSLQGTKVRQSLKERASYFGVSLEEHHHAGADARACAEIVIASINAKQNSSLVEFCETFTSNPIKSLQKMKPQTSFWKKQQSSKPKFPKVSISEITASTDVFNENHAFYEKNVVFTGDLHSLDRKAAMQLVVNAGGIIKSSVSSKTNYLVVGIQDKQLVGSAGISSKEKKAFELKEKGKDIEILNEQTFLQLAKKDGTN